MPTNGVIRGSKTSHVYHVTHITIGHVHHYQCQQGGKYKINPFSDGKCPSAKIDHLCLL